MAHPCGRRHRAVESALVADYVVLGGGNAKLLKELAQGVRLGENSNAFRGGQRLWGASAFRSIPQKTILGE